MNAVADIMDIHVEELGTVTIIDLHGELDSISTPLAQDQIMPLVSNGRKFLLDMSGVTYMSSAGLRILLMLYRAVEEQSGEIVIAGLRSEVEEVMSLTGFLEFFSVYDTRRDGLASLQ